MTTVPVPAVGAHPDVEEIKCSDGQPLGSALVAGCEVTDSSSETSRVLAAAEKLPTIFSKLSDRQLDVLCNVAFGGHGGYCNPRTLKSLAERGLIEKVEITDRTRMGTFVWATYEMPLHVHIQFCEWCSKTAEDPA